MGILAKIFTWWDGATIGTALYSARRVIYNGANDASRVDPDWHGWLHGTFDGDPESYLPPKRSFEVEASGNPTGSPAAYRPQGALEKGGHRASATGDYEAWSPDAA